MAEAAFKIEEVLSTGWKGFTKNAIIFILLALISFFAVFLANILFGALPYIISLVLNAVVSAYFMMSVTKAGIIAAKNETITWNVLKNDLNMYLKFLAVLVILSVIFMVAFFLLIIPALLAFAVFFPVTYIIIDKNAPIIEAFQQSWSMTTKQFGTCLVFALVCILIAFAGAIPLGIGLLIAVPLIYTACAAAYAKMDASAAPAATIETAKTE